MVDRNLTVPHRTVVVTDRPDDLPSGISTFRMPPTRPEDTFRALRRLWMFSDDAKALGSRILHLDLDVVITGNLNRLVDRDEPLVLYRSESGKPRGFGLNPTVMLLTTGVRADIWDRYRRDPEAMLVEAEADGWGRSNSDQAVISYALRDEDVPVWTEADGIRSYRTGQWAELPDPTTLVSFHGPRSPADAALQAQSPWIARHWC